MLSETKLKENTSSYHRNFEIWDWCQE